MHRRDDGKNAFKYPWNRLLPLRDMISQELLHHPDMLDRDNKPCLLVIKNVNTTAVERATGLFSFFPDKDTDDGSKEWGIYNYANNSGVFSAPDDSGSIIVDDLGRIGGLLTGGARRHLMLLMPPPCFGYGLASRSTTHLHISTPPASPRINNYDQDYVL